MFHNFEKLYETGPIFLQNIGYKNIGDSLNNEDSK